MKMSSYWTAKYCGLVLLWIATAGWLFPFFLMIDVLAYEFHVAWHSKEYHLDSFDRIGIAKSLGQVTCLWCGISIVFVIFLGAVIEVRAKWQCLSKADVWRHLLLAAGRAILGAGWVVPLCVAFTVVMDEVWYVAYESMDKPEETTSMLQVRNLSLILVIWLAVLVCKWTTKVLRGGRGDGKGVTTGSVERLPHQQ
jgi:hypothetical protein